MAVLFILILSALIGKYILNAFGILMDEFQIVGGVIIAYIGFGMFNPSGKPVDGNQTDKQTLSTLIMFAASPATIATVIALSAVHNKVGLPMNAMVGVILAVLVTWIIILVLVLASGSVRKGGQQIVTR